MKYSSTARVLSTVFHAMIFIAFGCLGFYFGFFTTPFYWTSSVLSLFQDGYIGAYNLYLELAILGLSLMSVSLYGLIEGIRSLLNPNDDVPVVKSFVAFIGDGYIAAAFFLLQGILLFDLVANNNVAFVIVMGILIAVILLIATNIPMVKLFDGKDSTLLLGGLSLSAAVCFAWGAVETFLSYLNHVQSTENGAALVNTQLIIGFALCLVIAALLFVSGMLILKNGVSNKKTTLLANCLTSGAVLTTSGLLFALSIMEIVYHDKQYRCHLEWEDLIAKNYGYGIMGLILASIAFFAAIYFFVISLTGGNNKKVTPKA